MIRILAGLMLWLACACAARAGDGAAPLTADPAQQILVLLQMPPGHFRADSNYSGSYGDAPGRSARRRLLRNWRNNMA